MSSIKHDPARRIRRIRRWLSKAVCVGAYSSLCHPFRKGDYEIWCDRVNFADSLFVRELAWLCGYAEERATIERRLVAYESPSCWHCGDCLEADPPAAHCERCPRPGNCDDEDCDCKHKERSC